MVSARRQQAVLGVVLLSSSVRAAVINTGSTFLEGWERSCGGAHPGQGVTELGAARARVLFLASTTPGLIRQQIDTAVTHVVVGALVFITAGVIAVYCPAAAAYLTRRHR